MTEPTDAEINALWRELFSRHEHSRAALVRAALAKWGQPAQAAEPVAYLTRNAEGDPAMLFFDKDEASTYCEDGVDPAPLYLAPLPVAREPLTPDKVKELVLDAGYDTIETPDPERAAFINGLRHGEQAHGIKGGQHGTE